MEVVSDVISGKVINPTGMKVLVKLGDSRLDRCRDILVSPFSMNDDTGVRRSSQKGKTPLGVMVLWRFA